LAQNHFCQAMILYNVSWMSRERKSFRRRR